MSQTVTGAALRKDLENFFQEDDLARNLFYLQALPEDSVQCQLRIKSELVLAGLPWFVETFNFLGASLDYNEFSEYEGSSLNQKTIEFVLPFPIALTGERIALNLLQRASSIATFTAKFVEKAEKSGIAILDTRKTTPGLRSLEKYAVRIGGGHNHRLGQTDMWMVKDNHKSFFGGVKEAVEFFQNMNGFYTPIEVEVHDLDELRQALELNVKHIMLDNFTAEKIHSALDLKTDGITYEVSGGVTLENIDQYLINGIDAISIGSLTYAAPAVDISLKYNRK